MNNFEENNNGYYNNNFNNQYPNMNNNNNNKQPLSYHIKRFLVGLLLVMALVFLLLLVLPTKSSIRDAINDGLNPLLDKLFQENIDTMKDAAIAYYTTDRLPKKEGDTEKLTLGEMLEMKLLLEIKDKNGDMCDTNASYVEITKNDKEYKMKINLKCGDEEDYVIVYLGCYSYCLNDICEKKEAKQVEKQVTGGSSSGTNIIKRFTNKVTTKVKEVTREVTKIVHPNKHYCEKVNGKYYNDKGKVVSKKAYEKACTHKPDTPDKPDKPDTPDTPEKVYKYKYEKIVTVNHDKEYGKWSDCEKHEYDENDYIAWGEHEKVSYEKLPSVKATTPKLVADLDKPVYRNVKVYIDSYPKWACANYEFFLDYETKTYYTTGGWQSVGIITSHQALSDTNNVKYVISSIDYDNCNNDVCSITPTYKYYKYVRTTSVTTNVSDSKEKLTAKCTKVVKKNIPVYTTEKHFVRYEKKKVYETKIIKYYCKRTRTVKDAYTTKERYTLWSRSKNDQSLINQGYKYTGIYEEIK